jgi:stage V sporulation protein SpoVS
MINTFPKEPEAKEERKRRLRASSSASVHKKRIIKNMDEDSMLDLLTDPDLNELEKDCVSSRVNQDIQSSFTSKMHNDASLSSLKELMKVGLMTNNQKIKIVNNVRRYLSSNLSKDEVFDEAISSLLISEEERMNILFSLNEVRDGTFKLKDVNITLNGIESLINEASGNVEKEYFDEIEDLIVESQDNVEEV